ncbi:MAPEG family protein [Pseudoalteromonas sp. G4]|uniref:MAPEG family protein n=1 Tax=Pseudoalteromonas sp. G4 TaxID=2992761 RepID=UPI00237E90FA|nr:MAPEG family protein [Pseudoalteromonas sp. G4]MDE3271457.1 MAPEG family protein [Pseudoalteromonas sp. G4]
MISIIPFYAALLGLLYVYLSVATVSRRKKVLVALGDGGDKLLQKKMRAHGNFQEYVPIAIILIGCFEYLGAFSWLIHILGMCLFTGRVLHAFGVSMAHEKLVFRVSGMGLTFLSILISCFGILYFQLIQGI